MKKNKEIRKRHPEENYKQKIFNKTYDNSKNKENYKNITGQNMKECK
jgi:hypothetical protein